MSRFIEQIFRKNKNYKGIVFLDRDGTVIENINYLNSKNQIKVLPGVVDGLKLLNKKNIAVVVITNQPVGARGLITIQELKKINRALFSKLSKKGAYVDAIFSCPHHPESDHSDIPKHAMKFRIKCECRKPGLLMYKKALSEFKLSKSFGIIGDHDRDMSAGRGLNVPTVLISRNRIETSKSKLISDFTANNFLDAVKKLF